MCFFALKNSTMLQSIEHCFSTRCLYYFSYSNFIHIKPCLSVLLHAVLLPLGIYWGSLNESQNIRAITAYAEWHSSLHPQSSIHVPLHLSRHPSREWSERSEESSQPFCGRLDVLGSSVFISRLVTAVRWSVSSQRPAGTVIRVTETDRRWTSEETCHRLTRLPAGGLHGTICFSAQQIIFLINL